MGEKRLVAVDVARFTMTRDALNTSFLALSAAIDKAVKAYIDHTQAVLDGDSTLDVSLMMQPLFNLTNVAQIAQQAIGLENNGVGVEPDAGNEKKRKRSYKQRDPNAPKRPLTAYFRYLGEQRGKLSAQLAADPNRETGKAGDISKMATENWNALSPEEQLPYKLAYQAEVDKYNADVAQYKATGTWGDGTGRNAAKAEGQAVAVAEVEAEDDETSSEEDSDSESDEEVPAPPPPPPAKMKTSSPEAVKSTPKSAMKKNKAGDTLLAPPAQFSSINPALTVASPLPVEAPSKKRKAPATVVAGADEPTEPTPKKRGRKSKEVKAAEDAAAAAAQLKSESSIPDATSEKPKKEKKRRKHEAAA